MDRSVLRAKLQLFFELLLRLFLAYLVLAIIYFVFMNGKFLDFIAYYFGYEFAYTISDLEIPIVIATFFLGTLFIIYRFISKKVNEANKVYKSFDDILNEDVKSIELPRFFWRYAEKLNSIKYEYVLSQKTAKEAEQNKNDLIMYMAHDLKTPLTSIIGYLTLLNEERGISRELEDKYLKIALDKSLRLEELTNQFFEITRYSLNDMLITKMPLNISIFFEQLADEFYPMLEEKNLLLDINKPTNLIYNADGDKLSRAFGNLLKNAISYSYENSVIKIMVDLLEAGFITVTMENRGATIPPHKLERLFDKFYRADESRGTSEGGAGLGLAITQDIINLHGGTIRAESENETIRFIIRLPR